MYKQVSKNMTRCLFVTITAGVTQLIKLDRVIGFFWKVRFDFPAKNKRPKEINVKSAACFVVAFIFLWKSEQTELLLEIYLDFVIFGSDQRDKGADVPQLV